MPQSLSRILVHLVFSTKNRASVLTPDVRPDLHAYLAAILRENACPCLKVGGVEDHVHLLFGLSRTLSIAKVLEIVKTSSSKWLKTKGESFAKFHWQSGYGAFSVGESGAETAIHYIQTQERRHRTLTFQEEYRLFLVRYKVDYDERHVWD